MGDTLSSSQQLAQHCEPRHFIDRSLPIVWSVHMLMFSSAIDFVYRHGLVLAGAGVCSSNMFSDPAFQVSKFEFQPNLTV